MCGEFSEQTMFIANPPWGNLAFAATIDGGSVLKGLCDRLNRKAKGPLLPTIVKCTVYSGTGKNRNYKLPEWLPTCASWDC
jgi:hypothetical protein